MPYTADKPVPPPSPEELRARVPGWGADLDPADRPAWPKERLAPGLSGAHWQYPEEQQPRQGREKSIEHMKLPPVFGTAQPLHGLSGAIRRYAYDRFSEGRTAHWLLLVAGDRVDATGAHLRSLLTTRPDNPITETGVLSELHRHPVASRVGRVDIRHQWIDPILVAGPWVLAGGVAVAVLRRALKH